ncbi:MAG: hypothetical protein C4520_13870 [Candidatus Abyssobacteria bacterium SURF_5]|uniref:Uncharacterized protein n=1 Tax=Abyssobacteria bacterium (strain SURF_5) TaxID=2093360 RepID=A0A3A4NCQ7_ABYX5|nr:MAG: hypothetical protein C4520_13870 [Candidatus Abyssubacteria bacterium SURF_5]
MEKVKHYIKLSIAAQARPRQIDSGRICGAGEGRSLTARAVGSPGILEEEGDMSAQQLIF